MKWLVSTLLLLPLSASVWGQNNVPDNVPPTTVRVNFSYKGAGIAPASPDIVLIASKSEAYVASRVIRESLSALGYRLLLDKGDGVVLLRQLHQYRTEPYTLSKEDVLLYNRTVDQNHRIPVDYIYASSVDIRYNVNLKRQLFEIALNPELHVRGGSSAFTPYDRAFERRFFTDRITKALHETFARLCPVPDGCEAPK